MPWTACWKGEAMRVAGERVIEDYLTRLDRSLRSLPAGRRRELVEEIEEHLADTLADLQPEATEADVRNALDRLGEPEEIAGEALQRLGLRPPHVSWTDPAAIVLLLIGGFVYLIGWIVGVVFLWLSDVWSTRDKILGTLVTPFGLALPLVYMLFATVSVGCVETTRTTTDGLTVVTSTCSDSAWPEIRAWAILIACVVGPIFTAIHLGRKLRRARALVG